MTERPPLEQRLDELIYRVRELEHANSRLTDRLAVLTNRPQVLIGRTEAESYQGSPGDYPSTGNTFGVITRDAAFIEEQGTQNITGDLLSAEVMRVARTVPSRFVPQHTDVAYVYFNGQYFILSGLDIFLEKATVGAAPIAPGGSGQILIGGVSKTGYWNHVHNDKTLEASDNIWVQTQNGSTDEYDIVVGPVEEGSPGEVTPHVRLEKAVVAQYDIAAGASGDIIIEGVTRIGYWDHAHHNMTLEANGPVWVQEIEQTEPGAEPEYDIITGDCRYAEEAP